MVVNCLDEVQKLATRLMVGKVTKTMRENSSTFIGNARAMT